LDARGLSASTYRPGLSSPDVRQRGTRFSTTTITARRRSLDARGGRVVAVRAAVTPDREITLSTAREQLAGGIG
jgi:hypothetical protein